METQDLSKIDFAEYYKKAKDAYDSYKLSKVKCAIIGQSGSGKSSLINAIFGERKCMTGVTETTMDAQGPFDKEGLSFYDLPGCGTEKFPIDSYIDKFSLGSYDCIIIVTANRFYENDRILMHKMAEIGKPVFVVRTKIDQAIEDGKYNHPPLSQPEVLNVCLLDIEQNISQIKVGGIYLLSSRQPTAWDLNRLLIDIANSLDTIKRDKFIGQINNTSTEILEKKEKLARKILQWRAVMVGINGLNPIPLLDISVDIGIIISLNREILKIFGIHDTSNSLFDSNTHLQALKVKIAQFTTSALSKDFILKSLTKYAPAYLGKSVFKWVPFAGQAMSVAIGYGLTMSYGKSVIKECKSIAQEILQTISK